jgi:exosortase
VFVPGNSLHLLMGVGLAAAGLWAYWPALAKLVHAWNAQPDYSHGFLVPPLAAFFLYARRAACPGFGRPSVLLATLLVAASFGVRWLSARYYFEFLDAWSILLWVAAIPALLGGRAMLLWCLPSIGFLWFMIPLPFTIETQLSYPLQRIATRITCWTLQLLGQPAFAEGNVILLGEHQLEVAQACSGLRLFVSIVALAYAYVVLVKREWWEKALLVLALVPIAIIANSARIVGTGLLFQLVSGDAARHFSHDFAGWAMIPFAAGLFWLVLWYLGKLFPEEEIVDVGSLIREGVSR